MLDSDLVVKTLKKEKAALTVEASLTLTLFMFFVLFLLSFNRVYSAQNTVSHATLQAADAISSESMLRADATEENIEKLLAVSNHIYAGESIPKSALEKLTNANIVEVARNNFISAIAESESKADSVLKKYGVKDGINGIDFSGCSYNGDTGETVVYVKYNVELQFPILGFKSFPMTKAARVSNMGKETYTITVKSANESMGTTSGTIKVKKGASTTISAYPSYGCKFVGWLEGGSENPKKLENISCDLTFTASFVKTDYYVVGTPNNSEYGSVSGSGTYKLNDTATLVATPRVAGGYDFLGWDENGNGVIDQGESTKNILSIKVRRDVSVKALFKPKKFTVNVQTAGRGTAILIADGKTQRTTTAEGNYVSVTLDFNTPFVIDAESNNYMFVEWTGKINSNTKRQQVRVPVGGGTYIANFEKPYLRIGGQKFNHAYSDETSSRYSSNGSALISGIKNSAQLSVDTNLKNVSYKWKSDSNVVSVDSNGKITAKGIGSARITVTASNGMSASVTVTTKYLMTVAEYRINSYSNNAYKYRYFLPDTVSNYTYGSLKFSTGPGWFYRYMLVDSFSGHAAVGPGQTTKGKSVNKSNKHGYVMHGTNPTDQTAYCFIYGEIGDIPFFNKGIVIKSIEG